MKIQAALILIIFLCGCATSQHTGSAKTKQTARSRGLSRQERAIEDACMNSRNIFYWTEEQLRKEFGEPTKQLLSPKDPSGQTQLYHFEAVGRLMEVYIKNGKVVDLNYTATKYGIGVGGGRKKREKEYAESLKKIEEAALEQQEADEYAEREEQTAAEDSFLEKEGIVIEKKDRAIVAYMNGTKDGEGNIYPREEQRQTFVEEDIIDDELLEPVF